MRTIRFFPTAEVNGEKIEGTTAVVADVLRATTTIVRALDNGCLAVIPVVDVKKAHDVVRSLSRHDVVLGGERKGRKIDGFDFGNSPQEYTRERIQDKVLVITTTNGTKALVRAAKAAATLVLSFLNLTAITDCLLEQESDVSVIAAGNAGDRSIEDSVCCGLLIDQLVRRAPEQFSLSADAAKVAALSQNYRGKNHQLLSESPHGEYLAAIGYESDLAVCADIDACGIVPLYADGRITISEKKSLCQNEKAENRRGKKARLRKK
ncbi:2-phosphosulfolactate phosphatase [candidate division KSB1 bacterium]|nr:2-phosphosulfolactate phosphatase [candidate division KSB1 bacterium]